MYPAIPLLVIWNKKENLKFEKKFTHKNVHYGKIWNTFLIISYILYKFLYVISNLNINREII